MFAPFWLLGIAALAGAVWHLIHFSIVHARAGGAGPVASPVASPAASHAPRAALFSRRLQWHELSDEGRHHLKRALLALGAFIGLCAGGVVAGVAAAFVVRV